MAIEVFTSSGYKVPSTHYPSGIIFLPPFGLTAASSNSTGPPVSGERTRPSLNVEV